MAFDVTGDAYGRFMGRFSSGLSGQFADFAGVHDGAGLRVLDVGCGPGVLTSELVERLGPDAVSAVDPSASFVAAAQGALPDVEIRASSAESMPFDDGAFDVALAQLVVPFMADRAAGVREMARVCRPGGTVAASVWDHTNERGPVTAFWRGVRSLDPQVRGEGQMMDLRRELVPDLMTAAGLQSVIDAELTATSRFETFEEWWAPYLLGVGPAGDYVASLEQHGVEALREACHEVLGDGPFEITAVAWAARGTVP